MGAIFKEEIRLDTSQHDKGLRDAAQSVGKYKKQIDNANKTIKGFESNVSGASSSISGMVSAFKSGDILGFASGAKNASTALTALIPTIGGTTAAVGGLGAAINLALGPVGLAVAAISGVVAIGVSAAKAVEEFDVALKDLSSLTGMVGNDLDDVGDSAKELSMKFGISATSIVDSFKLIGSQAPELLQDKEGLEGVTEAALVLARAAGIEVTDAAKGITTVMNQMGVSASEATGIINSLAAGSKNGAGDVAYLQAAIEKCGTSASTSGLSYQQLIGTIETLAPKFSSADVAGTALKGTLTKLTTQANSEFNPAIVGLDKALENLDNANLSSAQMLKLFGESNLAAATTLIQNREALQDMTEAVTGTNTAYEQMETKSGSLSETFNILKASWNAFMITMGESRGIQITLSRIKMTIDGISKMVQVLTKVQDVWNEVIAVICALVQKMWTSYIKPIWDNIAKAITDSAIFKAATKLWNSLLDAVYKVFNQIANWWNDFKKWLGLESNASVTVKQNVSVTTDVEGQALPIVDGDSGKIATTTKGKTKVPTKGSLSDTEAQINALSTQLKDTDTNDKETIEALKKQIAELQKIAEAQKIELGLAIVSTDEVVEGSLKDIETQLSKAKEQLSLVNPKDTETVAELQEQIRLLTEQQYEAKIALGLVEVKPEAVKGSLKYIQNEIAKQKAIIQITSTESPEYLQAIETLKALTLEEQTIKVKIESDTNIISKEQAQQVSQTSKDMYDGLKNSWGAATGLANSIADISKGFEDMTALEKLESIGNTIFSVIDNVTTLIGSVNTFSKALSSASAVQTATSAANVASTQAETSASLANTVAKSGEAIAGATASGAELPFPANLAAIAAGVATVVGVLAMISGFADGGIVGGKTTVGDYNLIRANKGEMILNNKQQAHLFRLLDSGGSNANTSNGEVKFRISGTDLVGVLNTQSNKTKRVS